MRYYLRKLAFYLVALWAAVTLNFFIPRMMPGDPADILMAKLQQHGGGVDPPRAGRTSFCSVPTRTSRCSVSTSPISATCCKVTSGSR